MPIQSTPSLGGSLNTNGGLVGIFPYYDNGRAVPSPQLGTVFKAIDGHDYIWAQANGAIASNVAVILTESTMQMATGAGAWTSPTVVGGTPNLQYAWFKKTAI